ncbi:ComEC/Rec2 family competence protein [Pseudalkalibacillus sp. Hm43]|uniref:ComEC/Rec2 family competence protein n=1 Tax=Pseudalkalibacillus sp. Hm43 TaxID=3450742 RepID=UPI003F442C29
MYAKPLILFSLFLLMLVLSIIPVKDEPVLFMMNETKGNAIKELNLNLDSKDVAISFLELKSGESTLLQDSTGKSGLINTGSGQSKSQFKQQMKIFKVQQIDTLVLTNIGKQFTGNLDWLLEQKKVKTIVIAEDIREELAANHDLTDVEIKSLKKGDRFTMLDKIQLEVAYIESRPEYNVGGLALVMNYGEHRFLYMGVSNKDADMAIVKNGPLDISLLKVGGFGHYFGTNKALLKHTNPQVAIIFKREGYTASDEVLNRLDDQWVEVLKPSEEGIVMVKCNEHTYEITQVPLTTPEMAFDDEN